MNTTKSLGWEKPLLMQKLKTNNKKKILITGGAGYLGINLYLKFKEFYEIIIIDNLITNVIEIEKLKNIKTYNFDIKDKNKLRKIFIKYKPNFIIHSAASYSDPNNWNRDIHTNTLGILNLIYLSEEFNIEKFLYFQSSNCYGETNAKKLTESSPCAPGSSYAISKTSAEQYLQISDIPYISLRLCIVYGPWHFSGPIPIFYKNAINKRKSIITESHRQFLYMDDFLKLIEIIILKKLKKQRIYNVSSNENISMQELFKKINNKLGINNSNYEVKSVSTFDIKSVPLDNSQIKKDFNWQPSTSIDQGLEYLLQWYENNFVGKDFSHLKIN